MSTGGRTPRRWRLRPAARDVLVALVFLAGGVWVALGLWPDPALRALALNPEDQVLIEWFLAADTRILRGEGLVTDRLNSPDGVNLLANAASPALGLLLAPVTLTLGAPVSFAVVTVGNLAATATGWYLLFARTLGAHRLAAALGGGFCGFAPAVVSHSNSHWHMTALWLVPAIVWSVVRLGRAAEAADNRRVRTSAGALAALVVCQYFVGAEVLYLTAVTLILVTAGYAVARAGRAARAAVRFLAGLAVATGLATLALAYPLWLQFSGPGSVRGGPFDPAYFSADLVSWPAYSPLSIAGDDRTAGLATGPAEYNTFLGWLLLAVVVAAAIWCRRHPLVPVVSWAALVMALLAHGPELVVDGVRTGLSLPYALLAELPVVDAALPQRYAIAVVPLCATILVIALDRAQDQADPLLRAAAPIAVGLAFLPLLPAPLPSVDREPVPDLIGSGRWRECVEPGGVLVPVPLPTPSEPATMRWAAAANAEFGLPQGFFIGPYGADGTASMGIFPRPTSILLAEVASTGVAAAPVSPEELGAARVRATGDLAYWGASCVAVDPYHPRRDALRGTLTRLLGPGELLADTWVWRVDPVTGAARAG